MVLDDRIAAEEALMSTEQAMAWATLDANDNRTIGTPAGALGADNEPGASLPNALQLTAAAVAADLLDAFVHVSAQFGVSWSDVEVNVTVECAAPRGVITQIDHQVRVGTDDAALVEIASHELEQSAPVLASLAGARRSGHVVMTSPAPRNARGPSR